jgi:predicted RNA binding protein YcfA (HicA-like mRNA interferase family)
MKYTEFHRKIKKNGWVFSHAEGSHYFYVKDGVLSPPIPFHGAKEMGEGLRKKLIKETGLK